MLRHIDPLHPLDHNSPCAPRPANSAPVHPRRQTELPKSRHRRFQEYLQMQQHHHNKPDTPALHTRAPLKTETRPLVLAQHSQLHSRLNSHTTAPNLHGKRT
ncbi:hypothetical protein M758_4G149800 [Ceratodon purpureus]|nr:hypothetical protein M758_4G149800 [Ceratodon purpureus]